MDSMLMSSSEKQWVTRIQMLQIQTANPYEEDYYYQVGMLQIQTPTRKTTIIRSNLTPFSAALL